ncbi:MAG TPA: AraC family transcriptional regulator [Candidatus Aquabacterium excrementipullorum]|nr:AraC family transcriptional regulator [Candidatus Aquabacterium excrementipullorum]
MHQPLHRPTHRHLQTLHFPVQYVEITESLLRARGGDVASVRRLCGLPPLGDTTAPQPDRINGVQLQTAMGIAREHCLPGQSISLQVLAHFPLTAHGMLGMLTIASATLGEALDMALQYHALVMPVFDMRRENLPGGAATVVIEQVADFSPLNDGLAELVVGTFRNIAPYTTPATASKLITEVCFKHAAPPAGQLADYERFFGAPVRFNAPYLGFTLSAEALCSPLTTGNRATRDSLEALLRRQAPEGVRPTPVTQRVKQVVADGLRKGAMPQATRVADLLAMSQRTLSRHLLDEGTSLSRIVEQVRIEHAERLLLGSRRPVQEVARQVGFADASSFSRAFRRATGLTPMALREQRANAAATVTAERDHC